MIALNYFLICKLTLTLTLTINQWLLNTSQYKECPWRWFFLFIKSIYPRFYTEGRFPINSQLTRIQCISSDNTPFRRCVAMHILMIHFAQWHSFYPIYDKTMYSIIDSFEKIVLYYTHTRTQSLKFYTSKFVSLFKDLFFNIR